MFLNVPFDRRYRALFEALVFAVHDCGFVARCALESDDGSVVRLDNIYNIMSECKYGIHDLSRTTLDTENRHPMAARIGMRPRVSRMALGTLHLGGWTRRRYRCPSSPGPRSMASYGRYERLILAGPLRGGD